MRYSFSPELNAKLKKEWSKIGLAKETQDSLTQSHGYSCCCYISKGSCHIARCLVDESLSLEKSKHITGYSLEELYPSATNH